MEIDVTLTKGTVRAELVKESARTLWVRLPDGHIIQRKKSKKVREATDG